MLYALYKLKMIGTFIIFLTVLWNSNILTVNSRNEFYFLYMP